ncbi:metallophosphoesterase family protein [candidate division CSSED10-310 bacterium]|uniref:Metallophosphoesterase family protein n=1 Tax=candidate division CSSED10-310 bacterium TaxID=2855610 RepID=A0ABV6YYD3_UNCC1
MNSSIEKPMERTTIAHFGDIHIAAETGEVAAFRRFFGKRVLGTINLRFLGRQEKFSQARRRFRLLLEDIRELSPDFVISSGDFSAMSFPVEFQIAHNLITEILSPLLSNFAVIPGNHDRYTLGEVLSDHFGKYFEGWMQSDFRLPGVAARFPYVRFVKERVALLFVDVVRFHPLALGKVTRKCLELVTRFLQSPELSTRKTMMILHYPPLRADGTKLSPSHRCVGIEKLVSLAAQYSVPAIWTGHVHQNYSLKIPDSDLYLINAGSGTHSEHSTYNMYTISDVDLTIESRILSSENNCFEKFDEKKIQL